MDQKDVQDLFWDGIVEKYENDIEYLEDEKSRLLDQTNSMETSLLPYMDYKMMKLLEKNPNANLKKLYEPPNLTYHLSNNITKLPDLSLIESTFDLMDCDIYYMDVIKGLSVQEQELSENINILKNTCKNLDKTAKKVFRLIDDMNQNSCLAICEAFLNETYDRLVKQNAILKKELASLKYDIKSYKSIKIYKENELINERNRAQKLEFLFKHFDDLQIGCDCLEPMKHIKYYNEQIENTNEQLKEEKSKTALLMERISVLKCKAEEMEEDVKIHKLKEMEEDDFYSCYDFANQ